MLAPPVGLTPRTVLDLYQRAGNPRGYTIQGAVNELQDPRGADKISGTSDDISHTTIDDVQSVHQRVIKFLVAGGRETNNALASQARFDADAKADTTVWRPSLGNWFITQSSNGVQRAEQWGLPGDVPVNGDVDGDGRSDKAVWRPSSGTSFVVSSATGQTSSQQWGLSGDDPVPGGYDGDGRSDFAAYRPSNGTWWVINSGTQGAITRQWGLPGDIPQPAGFDGDGRLDFAVWRPAEGNWYVTRSSDDSVFIRQWGLPGDIPVANAHAAFLTRGR